AVTTVDSQKPRSLSGAAAMRWRGAFPPNRTRAPATLDVPLRCMPRTSAARRACACRGRAWLLRWTNRGLSSRRPFTGAPATAENHPKLVVPRLGRNNEQDVKLYYKPTIVRRNVAELWRSVRRAAADVRSQRIPPFHRTNVQDRQRIDVAFAIRPRSNR